MILRGLSLIGFFGLVTSLGISETPKSPIPYEISIAVHTFFDFGPPFDFYELLNVVKSSDNELSVERALVTPHGLACVQPATVESKTITIHKSMTEFLGGKNPCAIPEKELHRELKRCKTCIAFSGSNVTMQARCGGRDRQLKMSVLDRDWFDSTPNTPQNTSWTMNLLSELDGAIGPRAVDKPIFPTGTPNQNESSNTQLVQRIRGGEFDQLFGKDQEVSKVVREADQTPPPPPSITIERVEPFQPISPQLPVYPPIAKAARVQGLLNLKFDVSAEGNVQNVTLVDGPKMLEQAGKEAVAHWKFLEGGWGKAYTVAIRFSLNCNAGPS
jgi:TonB family protein